MPSSGVFELVAYTTLHAADVFAAVDTTDSTQAAQGSLKKITSSSVFANAQPITVASGTVTLSTPVFQATQTWNAGGVTFTGIDLNVTNTASAAGSLLANLRVGGTSQWKVDKSGNETVAGTASILGASGGVAAFAGDFYNHCMVTAGFDASGTNNRNTLSAQHQVGFYSAVQGNATATGAGSFVGGFETALGAKGGGNLVYAANFNVGSFTLGTNASVTNLIGYLSVDDSAGTNNAHLCDFASATTFTGNWYIYYGGSRASRLGGALTVIGATTLAAVSATSGSFSNGVTVTAGAPIDSQGTTASTVGTVQYRVAAYDALGYNGSVLNVGGIHSAQWSGVDLYVSAALALSLRSTGMGFNGTAAIAKPTVTGAKGGNAALGSLMTALANYGLVVDSTTA